MFKKLLKLIFRIILLLVIFLFFYSYPVYLIVNNPSENGIKNKQRVFGIENVDSDKSSEEMSVTVKKDGGSYLIVAPVTCYNLFSIETECSNKNVWDFIIEMPIALVLRAPVCFVQSYLYNKKFDDCNFTN